MNDDDIQWLMDEFALTAERARDRGIAPHEFLIGLQRYGKSFLDDFADSIEAASD